MAGLFFAQFMTETITLHHDRELIPPKAQADFREYRRDGSCPRRARRSKQKSKPKPKKVKVRFSTGKRGRPRRDSVVLPVYLSREVADTIRPIRQRSMWIERVIMAELVRLFESHGKTWQKMPKTLSDVPQATKPKKRRRSTR